MEYDLLDEAFKGLRDKWPKAKPVCGLILGSGWGDVAAAFEVIDTLAFGQIRGLGTPGVVGHSGRLVWGRCAGLETFMFQGRRHWYEGEGWTPVALPLYVMKQIGVKRLCLTNAAGGIRPGFKPGDLMVIDDHINWIGANPLLGQHNPVWGPRFPDQSHVYDAALRQLLHQAGAKIGLPLHSGVYLAGSGPTYETPAEIKAYKTLGADAVGMSTVPEALLANAAGLRVVGLSCISNLAAGISPTPLTHEEVTAATKDAMPRMRSLLQAFWQELAAEK